MTQKTFIPKSPAKSERKWYLIDATDKVVGRLATEVAVILRGKNKPTFTPHMDMGDYVIIINAEKVKLTGTKEDKKTYVDHSGYLGNIKVKPFKVVQQKNPTRILSDAIHGMVPINRLGKTILDKLFIYSGSAHPHAGQNPINLNI